MFIIFIDSFYLNYTFQRRTLKSASFEYLTPLFLERIDHKCVPFLGNYNFIILSSKTFPSVVHSVGYP